MNSQNDKNIFMQHLTLYYSDLETAQKYCKTVMKTLDIGDFNIFQEKCQTFIDNIPDLKYICISPDTLSYTFRHYLYKVSNSEISMKDAYQYFQQVYINLGKTMKNIKLA